MTVTDDRPSTDPEPTPESRLDALERDVKKYRLSRDGWTFVIFGLAALAVLGAVFASIVALTRDGDGGGGGEAAAAAQPITANLSEFQIQLSTSSVATPGVITINNNGTTIHNLGVKGTDLLSPDIPAGGVGSLDISSLSPGVYELYCKIAGHEQAGMITELTIGGDGSAGSAAGTPAASGGGGHANLTPEEAAAQDQAMLDSINTFLGAVTTGEPLTEGVGAQLLEPEILPDGTKHFTLTAAITDWEVAPGVVVQAWTYNGTVPGPTIHVDPGDKVEVEITNNLPVGTDIHWHGIDVPNDQDGVAGLTQDLIMPGDTYTYSFTVEETAVGMYHAHAHGDVAVPNGLFAAFEVGDLPLPTGQTVSGLDVPADVSITQRIPMVVNDAGEIGLSLNGKSFPATQPYTAKVGDWFQVDYYNEGLQVHPMHLHGFEQIVIAKDGEILDQPYAADTILVGPGERYSVLVYADRPGAWVWHCHILTHAESPQGLFGMVTAVVVSE